MKQDPLKHLFPPDLSEETVDILFTFLLRLTDSFNEIYADQIRRTLEQESFDPLEPQDVFDDPFDDEIPF